MAKTTRWTYDVVKPYSAPLTKSAVNRQDAGVHDRWVSEVLAAGIRFMMEEHPNGAFKGYSFKDNCHFQNIQLKTSKQRPDFYYEDATIVIIGEAKVTKSDLCERHTLTQLLAYIEELESPVHAVKDKYLVISTPFNIGGIARKLVLDKIRPRISGDIEIVFLTEYDGKTVPAPDGWEDQDFSETKEVSFPSAKYGMVPAIERWVDVEELRFDPTNSRLLGVESAQLTQQECYERLLADGDSTETDAAIARRPQMMVGAIHNPIWITSDNIVHVGNSRTAYAKCACEMTNGHAPGYAKLKVWDFGDADGNMLYDLKQEEQAFAKLDQGRVHDAMDMWRRHHHRNQSIDELYNDIFNRGYEPGIIVNSIATIDWLVKNGYASDKAVMDMYWPAYPLVHIAWDRINKDYARAGITCKSLLDTIAKTPDPVWRTRKGAERLAKAVQDPQAPEWKLVALKGFIAQQENWATTKAWDENYAQETESHRYTANMAQRQLKTAITSVDNSKRETKVTLEELRTGNKAGTRVNARTAGIYSKNEIETLLKHVADLEETLKELKSDLGDALIEHIRNKQF